MPPRDRGRRVLIGVNAMHHDGRFTLEEGGRERAGGNDRVHAPDQPARQPGVMPLRRRGEDEFQRPAERAQQNARNHLVVAPCVPDQRRAAAPEFCQIGKTDPRDPLGGMGTEPRGAKHFGELRRHHTVGRSHAGIAPVQIRHDQLQIIRKIVLDRHVRLRLARVPIRNIKHSDQFTNAETHCSPRPG